MRRQSRTWVWIIALLAGAIVGSVVGEVLSGVAPILARGFAVGLQPQLSMWILMLSRLRLVLASTLIWLGHYLYLFWY